MPYTVENLITDLTDYGLNPGSFTINDNQVFAPCTSDSNFQFRLVCTVTEKVVLFGTYKLLGSIERGALPFYLQIMDNANGVKLYINPSNPLNRDNNWVLELGFEVFPETYSREDLFLRLDLLFYNIDKILNSALDEEIVTINSLAANPDLYTAEQV